MMTDPIATLLDAAPADVPQYLAGFTVRASLAAAQSGDVDREVIDDAFGELDRLVKAGAFAWAHFAARGRAAVSVTWHDDGFSVEGSAAGLHHNVLVAVLRMIVALHHTPAAARAELVAALGEDAEMLAPAAHWRDLLAGVRIERLDGADERKVPRAGYSDFVIDGEIAVPRGWTGDAGDDGDGERLIARGAEDALSFGLAAEDDFLRVCNTGTFRSVTRIDEIPEEASIFVRNGDSDESGAELVIDDYPDQLYGVIELLNVVSGGRCGQLDLRRE